MPTRKEIGATLLWTTLTTLVILLAFVTGRFSVNVGRVRSEAFEAGMAAMEAVVEERYPGFFEAFPPDCGRYTAAERALVARCAE